MSEEKHRRRKIGCVVLDRECGRDCVSQMRQMRSQPEALASALEEMGVTENGDEVVEPEEGQ